MFKRAVNREGRESYNKFDLGLNPELLIFFSGSFFIMPPRVSLILCITINALRSIFSISEVSRFTSSRVITVKIMSLVLLFRRFCQILFCRYKW